MTTTRSQLSLSRRVSTLKPSITVALNNRAKAMKASGIDVLSFAAGEPDFDTPQPIKDAAIKAIQDGQTKYTPHTRRYADTPVHRRQTHQRGQHPGTDR